MNLKTLDPAGRAELDDRPIVARPPAAFGLPAVAHVCSPARHDQIMTMSKEHITARNDQPSIFRGRKINLAAELFQAIPVGHNLAIHSQPRHAPIRIDLETQMSP